MHHVTIRDVDPRVKSALEARAEAEGISQTGAARQVLARGVRVALRNLGELGAAAVRASALDALGRVDRTEPAFSDEELDALADAETERTGSMRTGSGGRVILDTLVQGELTEAAVDDPGGGAGSDPERRLPLRDQPEDQDRAAGDRALRRA